MSDSTSSTSAGTRPEPSALAQVLHALRRPWVTALVALLSVAAVVGLGQLLVPAATTSSATATEVPVASTELVCSVTSATAALQSTISAAVAPLPSVTDGAATLADLAEGTPATAPLVISDPGATVTRVITGKPGPALLARSSGSFAAGFSADQIIRSGQGRTRGLAAAPCARPLTEGWLVGGASTVGRITQLLLVNDDDRPAQVDVLVYGPEGPVTAPAGSGLVLPAASRRQVRLDTLAPNQAVTAIHVIARSGRIGVSALDTSSDGLLPLGTSLLPVTQADRSLVIPAVPSPVASARLVLLSPDEDTTVTVKLLTPEGEITPVGLEEVDLDAGRVTTVDLTPVLNGAPAGVLIRSTAEVVAGVEVGTGTGTELRERDATAPVPVLSAPGIVVGLAAGALTHTVDVAAPAGESQVTLDLYVPGSATPAWTVNVVVPAGSLRRIAVPVTSITASSILVVTPRSGAVHVSREISEAGARGPMLALAPLYPTRATTLVPPVVGLTGSSTG